MNIDYEISKNVCFETYKITMKINDNNIMYNLSFNLNFSIFLELNKFVEVLKRNECCKLSLDYNLNMIFNNQTRIFSIIYFNSEICFNNIMMIITLLENIIKDIVKKENECDKMIEEKYI